MLDLKVKIEADDAVVAAINNLAEVLGKLGAEKTNTPAADAGVSKAPAPVIPLHTTATEAASAVAEAYTVPAVPVTPPATQAPAAPAIPTAAPQYTLEMISAAGSALIDAGKMEQLLTLLGKYGVDNLTALKPDQYGAMATDLRALGARI